MGAFCQRAEAGVYNIEEEFDSMVEVSQLTSLYLGEAHAPMDKLFIVLSRFLKDYMSAQKEHGTLIKKDTQAALTQGGARARSTSLI